MSHSDEMADLCEGIAEVLKERGHTVGTMINGGGRVCLLGAGRLAQDSNHDFSARRSPLATVLDQRTTDALGFGSPTEVVEHNDGHIKKSLVNIPVIHKIVITDDKTIMVDDGYRTDVVEEFIPPISQQQAIDLAMDRAKYWRNQ